MLWPPNVAAAAEVLWQASGRIGAHRLHPFVPELLDRLVQYGELSPDPALDKLLRQASRPTLARLLAPARARYPLRGATTTRPSTWLKQQIPIRTFTEWNDARPGFLEVDLVAHCGGTTRGFFLFTLCAVDVATSWIELQALWGKGQARVRGGISRDPQTAARASGRPRQRQRFRVQQPPAVLLLSARGPHLYAQPRLEEERQCPRRAEELRHRPPARRL